MPDATGQRIAEFQPDCLYHLAACAIPKDCGDNQPNEKAWRVNVIATRSLLYFAASLDRTPRFVLISSSHVYASSTEGRAVAEDAPAQPKTAYGVTKLAAEREVWEAVEDRSIDGLVARPFQHAGPRQNPNLMLPEWCRQLAERGERAVRVLNLDSYLDMTDVRDVVRAYRLLARLGRTGETYNVGSGVTLRSGDVFQQLQRIAGTRRSVIEVSPGPRYEPIADNSRLRNRTGWRPEIPLEDTLRDAYLYWKDRVEP
jgi:GDP-4-dehydro-6-deoxy-D-mannose reductase